MDEKPEMKESRGEPMIRERIPLKGWRKSMAEIMARSHSEPAAVTQMREVDFTEMIQLRRRMMPEGNPPGGIRISYSHLLIKAAAQALREHPDLNSGLAEGEIRVYDEINIAMAVALEDGGLLAPVIRQVDRLSIREIAERATRLAEQIRARRFSLNDLRGGTFTFSNAGMYGTDYVTLLIPGGQSAALGVGRIVPKPMVRNGEVTVRSMMGLSLSYDHRVLAGATAAKFFSALQELIEKPEGVDWGD